MLKRKRVSALCAFNHPKLNYQERLWHILRYEETTDTCYEPGLCLSMLENHAVFIPTI
jgi:hypothetical protein